MRLYLLLHLCVRVRRLPFGMWNMPPPSRILWNKNASHCSNAVWRDPVSLLVSQHSLDWTVQIRVHIFLLKALQSGGLWARLSQAKGCLKFFLCFSILFFSFYLSSTFTVLNFSPLLISPLLFSVFQSSSKHGVFSTQHPGRHLLGIASEEETEAAMGPDPLTSGPSEVVDR